LKTAIITGASRGIGRATAIEFAKAGWNTAICARNSEELHRTASVCKKEGGTCFAQPLDLSAIPHLGAFVNDVLERFQQIDVLINNAGVSSHEPFLETDMLQVRGLFDVNLFAPIQLTRLVLPAMLKQKSGIILNVISSAGKFVFPNMSAYCASKHGLLAFTKALALELKDNGVASVAVCPARVDTEMHRKSFPEVYENRLLKRTIMTPENVAKRIVEIAISKKTRNGQVIDIDPWHTNLYHCLKR